MKFIEIIENQQKIQFVLPDDINADFVGDYDPVTKTAHVGSIISGERGAGSKAMYAFEKWARANGATMIRGEARIDSIPFWHKMGFRDRNRGERLVPIWKVLDAQ